MSKVDRHTGTQPLGPGRPGGASDPARGSNHPAGADAGKTGPAKTDRLNVSVNASVTLKDGKPAVVIEPVAVTGSPMGARETAELAGMSAKVRRAVVEQIVKAVVAQVAAQVRPVIAAEVAKGLAARNIPPMHARELADQIAAGAMPEIDKAVAAQITAKLARQK